MWATTESPAGPEPMSPPSFRPSAALARWFGVEGRITRLDYLVCGLLLAIVKYAVEAGMLWLVAARFFYPWDFVNPVMSVRTEMAQGAPAWLPGFLFLWTLPFVWVAVSMSVRRAADAGCSPWLGMMVLVPLLNLPFMLTFCTLPSGKRFRHVSPRRTAPTNRGRALSAAVASGVGLLAGAIIMLPSIYWEGSYGAVMFLGGPLMMGATAAYVDNRHYSRGFGSAFALGAVTICFGLLAFMLFALEGAVCLVMAAPLMVPLGAVGGLLGKAIADRVSAGRHQLMAAVALAPLAAGWEARVAPSPEYAVVSSVEIDAPSETVWKNVVAFPELPAERPWYFRWGISCPERARIEGHGVGAVRYCEFTTGAFVEPITRWDQPRWLAFDVVEQPDPMFELSFHEHVHPPHLDGYLRSTHGEFRLIALPTGGTRLVGSTWYRLRMYPAWYWTGWSDGLIHRIHERVLEHIKRLAEADPVAGRVTRRLPNDGRR